MRRVSWFLRMTMAIGIAGGLGSHARAGEELPATWFEIFKLAPGQQEQFVRDIAKEDEVAAAGGQPPIQLFFHEHGADWDVLLMKPVSPTKPTPEQERAMAAKRLELGLPSGPAYFLAIREQIASHTDTKTVGPVSAAEWLETVDQSRAINATRSVVSKPGERK